jgi:hypothetical protein
MTPRNLAAQLHLLSTALATIFLSSLAAGIANAAPNACEPEILRAADRYGVPAGILYAVGLTETGIKRSPQPNALNTEGKAVVPTTRGEALATFENARREGKTLIDLGCMQIQPPLSRLAFPQRRRHARSAPERRLRRSVSGEFFMPVT